MDNVVLSRRRTARGSTAPQALLVASNPCGVAGMTAITVRSARQVADLEATP